MNLHEVKIFAERAHAEQPYTKEFGYTFHLQHVELIALRFGHSSELIRKACWMHDVLEDTGLDQDDLREAGVEEEVIQIVECVSDGPGKNRKERKMAMYPICATNENAIIVKICDRIANVEMSVMSKSSKFKMYFKEFPDMQRFLRKPDKHTEMWNYLTTLLYSDSTLPTKIEKLPVDLLTENTSMLQ